MKTDFNEERKTKNEELGFAPTARAKLRLSQVLPNVSAAFLKCILAFFVLNSSFFVPSANADVSDYRDMLATLEFAQSAKSARAAVSDAEDADSAKDGIAAVRSARNFKDSAKLARAAEFSKDAVGRAALALSAERFADLRLWVLQNTKPRVFIDIATASPATDMGYFRIDFDRADKFEKLQMLRDEFGIE